MAVFFHAFCTFSFSAAPKSSWFKPITASNTKLNCGITNAIEGALNFLYSGM